MQHLLQERNSKVRQTLQPVERAATIGNLETQAEVVSLGEGIPEPANPQLAYEDSPGLQGCRDRAIDTLHIVGAK